MGGSLLNYSNGWRKQGPLFEHRPSTPNERPQDEYLLDRRSTYAGVFDYECWPFEGRGTVSFSLYHHGEFYDKEPLYERRFESPEATRKWFSYARVIDNEADELIAKRYCTPVIARTEAFRRLQINEVHGIRRQRGDDRYMIYLQSDSRLCPDWHVIHVHAIRLVVFDNYNRICYEEVFGCDDVWKGVRRYQKITTEFDNFLMEEQL